MTQAVSANERHTVIYDADCGFCRWALALLLRLDRAHRLPPLALGTQRADALLPDLEPDERAASWHLVSPGGQRESASAALPFVLALLPGGWAPAAVLYRIPRATDRGYRWVAAHRSRLSHAIPTSAERRATALIDERARESA
jgi:predicted DCC family thiol-disulfide oxidoreductase YuxK